MVEHHSSKRCLLVLSELCEPPRFSSAAAASELPGGGGQSTSHSMSTAQPAATRQHSHPMKVRMASCSGVRRPRQVDRGLWDAASLPQAHSQACSSVNISMAEQAADLELKWVKENCSAGRPTSKWPQEHLQRATCSYDLNSGGSTYTMPQRSPLPDISLQRGALSVVVYDLPAGYVEDTFVEELRDGGFIAGRDYWRLRMVCDQDDTGVCVVHFVDVSVTHAFQAAFDGRRIRHADSSFRVAAVPEHIEASWMPLTELSRFLGA